MVQARVQAAGEFDGSKRYIRRKSINPGDRYQGIHHPIVSGYRESGPENGNKGAMDRGTDVVKRVLAAFQSRLLDRLANLSFTPMDAVGRRTFLISRFEGLRIFPDPIFEAEVEYKNPFFFHLLSNSTSQMPTLLRFHRDCVHINYFSKSFEKVLNTKTAPLILRLYTLHGAFLKATKLYPLQPPSTHFLYFNILCVIMFFTYTTLRPGDLGNDPIFTSLNRKGGCLRPT